MTRLGIAVVFAPLVAVSLFVVARVYRERRTRPIYRCLLFTGAAIIGWQLAYLAEILAGTAALLRYLYPLSLPFAGFTALGSLLVVAHFYGLERYLSRGLLGMMLVLPLITAALAFSGDPFGLLYATLEVHSLDPVYTVSRAPGMWFWAHAVYCYLMLGIGLFQAIGQHRRLPSMFRVSSSLMIAALLVAAATSLVSITLLLHTPLNISIAGSCIALVLLYTAMTNNRRLDFLLTARSLILHYLDIALFILDNDRCLIECNRAGKEMLSLWTGQSSVTGSMDAVLRTLEEERGAHLEEPAPGERGRDLYLRSEADSRVYNLREEVIADRAGRPLGAFLLCTDVTENRRLIRWLEKTAGTDALTGLPNRSSLALRRAGYEAEEALPLSVIVGDVNRLKEINDSLGHRLGDDLIVLIATALQESCPPGGSAFRTGGDEFVLILPNTDEAAADTVMADVTRRLDAVTDRPFRPSIALGRATRATRAVSLDQLLELADQSMYHNKKQHRS